MKKLLNIERSRWLVSIDFDIHNLWIGLYWKKHYGPRIDLWLNVLPTLCLHIELVYRDVFKKAKTADDFRNAIDSLDSGTDT